MTAPSETPKAIGLIAFGQTGEPPQDLLGWLQAVLPELSPDTPDASRQICLYPGLVSYVAQAVTRGDSLAQGISAWCDLAEAVVATGPKAFALAEDAVGRDPLTLAAALKRWSRDRVPKKGEHFPPPPALPLSLLPHESAFEPVIDLLVSLALTVVHPGAHPEAARANHLLQTLAERGAGLPLDGSVDALRLEEVARATVTLYASPAGSEQLRQEHNLDWMVELRRTLWSEAQRAAEAERQAQSSRSKFRSSVAAKDQALAHLAERDAYINKLHNSKSWRVTAPLRLVISLLKRH